MFGRSGVQSAPGGAGQSPSRRAARALLLAAAAVVLGAAIYNALLGRSLGSQEVHLYGQRRWVPGAPASVRVVLLHHQRQQPIAGAVVRVLLQQPKVEISELATGTTNAAGTLDASFRVPDGEGRAHLLVIAESRWGRDFLSCPLELVPAYRVSIALDRPAYRVGQRVRIHIWVHRAADGQPAAARAVALRAFAPPDVAVATRSLRTDSLGSASAVIHLAPGAPPGTYRFRAAAGAATVEATVPVVAAPEPPFPVSLEDVAPCAAPGGLVRGRVRGVDELGSPLRGAMARVWLANGSGRRISWTTGRLDERGELSFGLPAPSAPALRMLRLVAQVTDSGLRTARAMQVVAITPQPIQLAAVPEGRALVPGVHNRIYVVTRYPDGSPASALVRYAVAGQTGSVRTGALGVASLSCLPSPAGTAIALAASDANGRVGAYSATLPAARPSQRESTLQERYRVLTRRRPQPTAAPMLLRPDRGIYAPGSRVRLSLFAPGADGPVYLDGMAAGQTAFTHSGRIRKGRGRLEFELPPALTGLVWLRAYRHGPGGLPTAAQRAVFVEPPVAAGLSLHAERVAAAPGEAVPVVCRSGGPSPVMAVLLRGPGVSDAPQPLVVMPRDLQPPLFPGLRPLEGPAPQRERQEAALAALALVTPPGGWDLHEDSYAAKQAQIQQRRAASWAWLRWAVLVILAVLWLVATRVLTRGQAHRTAPRPDAEGADADAGTTPPEPRTGSDLARFLLIAAAVGLAVTLLFRLMEWGPAQDGGSPFRDLVAALDREQRRAAATRRPAPFPRAVPRSIPVPEVAFWAAGVHDDSGEGVRLRVPVPMQGDWYLAAVSVSGGQVTRALLPFPRAGELLTDVSMPLIVRPGDLFCVSIRVRNPLTVAQPIRLKLMVGAGLAVVGKAVLTESLPGGAGLTRHFQVQAGVRPGPATVTLAVTDRARTTLHRRELATEVSGGQARLVYAGRVADAVRQQFQVAALARTAVLSAHFSMAAVAAARLETLRSRHGLGALGHAAAIDLARLALPGGPVGRSPLLMEMERDLQELLACQDAAGGFSGTPGGEPDVVTTAYAVSALRAAEWVLPGAARCAARARQWLHQTQRSDGSWEPGSNADRATVAAFAAWCLGTEDTSARRALAWAERRVSGGRQSRGRDQPHLLALLALAAPADSTLRRAHWPSPAGSLEDRLAALATGASGRRHWIARSRSLEGFEGEVAVAETTALAVLALSRSARHRSLAREGTAFLAETRHPDGSWGSALATGLSLRALGAASPPSANGVVAVRVNGHLAGTLSRSEPALDLLRWMRLGANEVTLRCEGGGASLYELSIGDGAQAASVRRETPRLVAFYGPWRVAPGDAVTFTARVTARAAGMTCLEVPLPAGFRPVREDLEAMREQGVLAGFDLGARTVTVWVGSGRQRSVHWVAFRLVAPGPAAVTAPAPNAYPAALPAARAMGHPTRLVVQQPHRG